MLKLKNLSSKVGPLNKRNTTASNSTQILTSVSNSVGNNLNQYTKTYNSNKEKKFANQFLVLSFTVIASDLFLTIISLRSIMTDYWTIFIYWRPVFRILIIIALSLNPIIACYYSLSKEDFKNVFKKRFNTQISSSKTGPI